ncbi:DNA internalization-related competence protein ComEC/Rec2 [Vibrio parahaemolyticus]|nr:DNA internalization-related competence protein ComEC/Rec2 [Vibrio parahaemolyticus]EJE4224643.1 DNA internalization-related competence protein ComEC/Rec2 [Vibrio parahaemolyticus]EKI0734187.1 DNA internalization-related competence protein ComEC/Rec2 [Vibrio parahaemolyticus]
MTLLEKSWTLALFVASVISSAWWPTMPDWRWLLLGIITTGSIIKLRRGLISIGVIVGFMVVIVHGNIMEYQRQALFQAGENSTIIGRVDSSFTKISHGYEGVVAIKQVNSHTLLPFLKPKVRLITPFPLAVNSEFTTNVLIKPIIGLRNEAGFDAEKQSMGSGVVARAVVTKDSYWVIRTSSSWRESIIQTVERDISRLEHFALIKALAFADRTGLTKEDWQSLRDSGLLHLVSISGLHIGMALTFGLALGGLIRLAMPRYWFLPSVSGLAFAIVYAWLADFSLPTTRAVSVCIIYLALKYWLVHWSPWRVLLLAVALQLFFQPFASFSLSFWLSYLSVGAVLFAVNTVQDSKEGRLGKLRILLLTQLILSLLIVPISGYFFSGFSWSSLVYNLVFIPWFGFVVVPIMFAALIASLLFPMLATVLWYLLDVFLVPLSWSVRYAIGTWQPISAEWTFVIAVVSVVLVLRHVMPRYVWMFVCVIVVMTGLFPKQYNQTWRIDVLDVGHGLAVLVEKEGRVLLYDTGKAWHNGSIAEQVITPVLHRRGYSSVDTMILSHADNDHAGGRKVIEQYFSPKHKLSSQSFLYYQPCIAAEKWKWQGLNIEVLWPPKPVVRAYNPHSCVISLEDPSTGFKMLFTGDIEAISEWILLREPEKLRSDVMLVPHHGSKSSSNLKFINAVEPSLAIASTAKLNQWGMPAPEVVQAYTDSGVSWLDTGSDGQITILLDGNNWRFESKRRETIEPWYRQMLRNRVE